MKWRKMSWDEVKSVSEPSYLVYILVEELDRDGSSSMEGCAKQFIVGSSINDTNNDIDNDTNNDIDNDTNNDNDNNNNTYSNKNMHKHHDIMRWRYFVYHHYSSYAGDAVPEDSPPLSASAS